MVTCGDPTIARRDWKPACHRPLARLHVRWRRGARGDAALQSTEHRLDDMVGITGINILNAAASDDRTAILRSTPSKKVASTLFDS
jgi:hypothetical protein